MKVAFLYLVLFASLVGANAQGQPPVLSKSNPCFLPH